jgi:hypothetical protein
MDAPSLYFLVPGMKNTTKPWFSRRSWKVAKESAEIAKKQEPMTRIADDAKEFIQTGQGRWFRPRNYKRRRHDSWWRPRIVNRFSIGSSNRRKSSPYGTHLRTFRRERLFVNR